MFILTHVKEYRTELDQNPIDRAHCIFLFEYLSNLYQKTVQFLSTNANQETIALCFANYISTNFSSQYPSNRSRIMMIILGLGCFRVEVFNDIESSMMNSVCMKHKQHKEGLIYVFVLPCQSTRLKLFLLHIERRPE